MARVDGASIETGDVELLAREGGVSPRAALERLIETELLAAEARRRGLEHDPVVVEEVRRAAARMVLERDVARSTRESSIPAELVAAAYERDRRRFDAPELRTVVHVLVRVPRDAARAQDERAHALSLQLHGEVVAAADPSEILALDSTEREGFTLVAQTVGPFARDDAMEPEFLGAAFALSSSGAVSQPVRTRVGWHVIQLLDVAAPRQTPVAERDAVLRRELLPSYRRQLAQQLLRRLESEIGATRDERAIATMLARDPLGEQDDGRGTD